MPSCESHPEKMRNRYAEISIVEDTHIDNLAFSQFQAPIANNAKSVLESLPNICLEDCLLTFLISACVKVIFPSRFLGNSINKNDNAFIIMM